LFILFPESTPAYTLIFAPTAWQHSDEHLVRHASQRCVLPNSIGNCSVGVAKRLARKSRCKAGVDSGKQNKQEDDEWALESRILHVVPQRRPERAADDPR